MKVERVKDKFQPVTITLETQEELDQLYAIASSVSFEADPDITLTLYDELSGHVSQYYGFVDSNVFVKR